MVTNAFDYNIRSEVISALMDTDAYTYAYDPIGNRKSEVRSLMSEVSTNLYIANALNQYSAITNFSSQVSSLSPSYDLDGNMLTYGEWSYTWNGENRLILASNAQYQVSFAYDHMGRRTAKIVDDGTSVTTNTFLYDGWNLIQERTHSQTHTLTNFFVWGKDLSGSMQGAGGIGGLLSSTSGTNILYHAYDANGNLTQSVDQTGTIRAEYQYDAFGNAIQSAGDLAQSNPFRFSTKYHDDHTGLVYYGYRYYNPELGRWLNRDPIGERGGLNVYGFVINSVLNKIDVLGLLACCSQCDPNEDQPLISGVEVQPVPNMGDPEIHSQIPGMQASFEMIQVLNSVLGIIGGVSSGQGLAEILAGEVGSQLAGQFSIDPNALLDMALNLYSQLQQNFSGVHLYTRISYSACRITTCNNEVIWVWDDDKSDWRQCAIGSMDSVEDSPVYGLYGGTPEAYANASACVHAHVQEINAQQGF